MTQTAPDPRPLAVVADDDPDIRMHAVAILEDAGYTALEAEHGDHAIAVLELHHPGVQLLFSDVQMPGGARDGFALAREAAMRWAHIAIVVASGQARPRPGDLPEGATFISKPFNAEIVRQHLRALVPKDTQPEPLKS